MVLIKKRPMSSPCWERKVILPVISNFFVKTRKKEVNYGQFKDHFVPFAGLFLHGPAKGTSFL